MTQSPYVTHREIFLEGKYGTAYLLQRFLLHQLAPGRFPFEINDHLGGFDTRHTKVYQDMKSWFWENGPASEGFREIAEILRTRREQEAQNNLEELKKLRVMNPADYPIESDRDYPIGCGVTAVDAHKSALELCEYHHERHVANGYIDKWIAK